MNAGGVVQDFGAIAYHCDCSRAKADQLLESFSFRNKYSTSHVYYIGGHFVGGAANEVGASTGKLK